MSGTEKFQNQEILVVPGKDNDGHVYHKYLRHSVIMQQPLSFQSLFTTKKAAKTCFKITKAELLGDYLGYI